MRLPLKILGLGLLGVSLAGCSSLVRSTRPYNYVLLPELDKKNKQKISTMPKLDIKNIPHTKGTEEPPVNIPVPDVDDCDNITWVSSRN